MGLRIQHVCAACNYEAVVSGGVDCGMVAETQTVSCEKCRELFDVVTRYYESREQQIPLRCPKSAKHPVRAWNMPDDCPSCGSAMKVDSEGPRALWD